MTTKFTEDHEYVTVDGDTGTVGITVFAQDQLGDVVFVELPEVGRELSKGDEAAVVESVKAASEIYAPLSGTVTEVNAALSGEPGLINQDPAGAGWLFKLTVRDHAELETLMDEAAYAEHAK
ncbi:glycine cleavage system H protein [Devosia pacifica]|uniref:Glycine cleavage system H protein n=1 Tax=Devosia pacifica TaxID=1335967 RepID=A0A918S9S7_9HYPH|nr:glycine cleavage system protein GcvH [Devosia pacifica]GHA30523.1 glycine cleavage system H protein [Devosia pacifica]